MIAPIYEEFDRFFSVLSYLKTYLFKNSTEPTPLMQKVVAINRLIVGFSSCDLSMEDKTL
jgi:hypothetical protein